MGRTESKQVVNQGTAQSAQDQQNAQSNLAATNQSVTDFNKRLGRLSRAIQGRYGSGGEYQSTQNTINTTAAAAGSKALGGDLALHALRTGENTAGFAPAAAEDRRQRQRDVTTQMAGTEADRLKTLTALQGQMLDESKYPASVYGSLYGTSVGGAGNQLNAASGAARTPGFWDTFLPAAAQGAGMAAGGFAAGCWVAAEIFGGWMEPRTVLVREWLNTEFNKSILGDMVLRLYVRFGESLAAGVRRSRLLRAAITPLFEAALRRARAVKTAQKKKAANSASVPKASPER